VKKHEKTLKKLLTKGKRYGIIAEVCKAFHFTLGKMAYENREAYHV